MQLEKQLEVIIKEESEKLISRYHDYHNKLHLEHERNKKRMGSSAAAKKVNKPDYWTVDKKFNPFYVRRKYKSIARSIAKKIERRTYLPNSPHVKLVDKPGGGSEKYQFIKYLMLLFQSCFLIDC